MAHSFSAVGFPAEAQRSFACVTPNRDSQLRIASELIQTITNGIHFAKWHMEFVHLITHNLTGAFCPCDYRQSAQSF